jgi:hypothetical protein
LGKTQHNTHTHTREENDDDDDDAEIREHARVARVARMNDKAVFVCRYSSRRFCEERRYYYHHRSFSSNASPPRKKSNDINNVINVNDDFNGRNKKRASSSLKSAGDGIDGVSSEEDKVVVRFWHHFGSSKKCAEKRASSSSSSSSPLFRNPSELEARVRRLHRYLGHNVDVPMTASNAPEILELDAEIVCKRLMFLFKVIPSFNGSKVSKNATLLTLEREEVERRVNAVVELEKKKWVGGGVDAEYAKECAKERMMRNPSVLLLDSVTAQCNAEEKLVQHR